MTQKKPGALRRLLIVLATVVMVVLTQVPIFAANSNGRATVRSSAIKIRSAPSVSAAHVATLSQGTKVTVMKKEDDWLYVSYSGIKGYVNAQYMTILSLPGGEGGEVAGATKAPNAPSTGALKMGDSGQDVQALQTALRSVGLLQSDATGYFGALTRDAVMAFQANNNLPKTGVVSGATKTKLNAIISALAINGGGSGKTLPATQAPATKAPATKTPATAAPSKGKVELVDWFTGDIQTAFPRGTTGTVKDIKTGKTFKIKRFQGHNHIDAEPLTAADTAIMKSIYGNWSWERRAILVTVGTRTFAASMNGMPHGNESIKNNNFDGQFCIHFVNSRTHSTNRVDSAHQAMIQAAYNAK